MTKERKTRAADDALSARESLVVKRRGSPPPIPRFIARQMPPMERFTVDVGGRAMHVMQRGHGRPVVMIHGNPTWGFLYRRVVESMKEKGMLANNRVIIPDLIGLGFSDKPRDGNLHTIENHSRWLSRALDALDVDDAVLVVQDWGGPIGMHAFAHQLDRLSGLVAMNTIFSPPRPGARTNLFHRAARVPLLSDLAFRVLQVPSRGLHLAQGDRESIRGDVARAYRFPMRDPRDNTASLALARMVPDSIGHFSIPALQLVEDTARAFGGPKAMVWGTNDPVLGRTRKYVASILTPDLDVETDAGHFLQEEVPDEITAAIEHVISQL